VKRLLNNLTFRVLTAITLGIILGVVSPATGKAMRPLGDTFVNLVKMVIGPIVFLTIVTGISNLGDLKKVGKVGGKAIIYFEIVTTFALAIGLVVVNLVRPGEGIDVSTLAQGDVSRYTDASQKMTFVDFLINIVPPNLLEAFVRGEMLQIVFVAVLFGTALSALQEAGRPVIRLFESLSKVFFRIVGIVMIVAPIGAFGAMAYTIGNFGLATLLPLGKLMLSVYITMAAFVFIVLNFIARMYRFSLWKFLKYIKEEILIVLGTSSSEAALPRMMDKLERLGCAKPVVGLVIPTGYSFNLDGTSIYLSMAVIFLAQVFQVEMGLWQQLGVLAILMLTSKGAAGVTGSGFIVLASTLAAMKLVPVTGIALLLGVDRFMSEARAIVNLIGNGVATVVIAKSEGAFDEEQAALALAHQIPLVGDSPLADEAPAVT
jgi:aerobic C4-dicarboxylate transport protein